jgi:cobyrinic acid a,c-diamide synthase
MMQVPSFMIAAAGSGSGKTVISCGLMAAFKKRMMRVLACKCGPDYIDPMFHREVLGVESENLDLFFCEKDTLKSLFNRHVGKADITVIEGVMGFFDGMSLDSETASSYDVARTLNVPVILVISCKGMALSVLPVIQGLLEFRKDSNICGIILNRVSPGLYPKMKEMIEHGLEKSGHGVPVIGYVPENPVFSLESRHLGLVTPGEIGRIRERLEKAGRILEDSIDLDTLISLAGGSGAGKVVESKADSVNINGIKIENKANGHLSARIAVARDEAFCFYYKDNLEFLTDRGCQIVEFSPIHDKSLPANIQGLILGGGYPELHTEELESNLNMRNSIRAAILEGLPCLAECGGFMYLQEEMENDRGEPRKMAGVLSGRSSRAGKLVRFGYIEIEAQKDGLFLKKGEKLKGHEFHHWDSMDNGSDCLAVKPDKKRSWKCMHMNGNLFAGYPHIHFYSNIVFAERFITACEKRNTIQ